jgi:hypothetical protein
MEIILAMTMILAIMLPKEVKKECKAMPDKCGIEVVKK